jgi:enoyl-CoA hydratase/carnithine racemase
LVSSDWIDTDRALAMGFIDLVVEDHDLLPVALQFAGKIAENPEAPVTSFLNLHRIFLKQGAGEASQFETNTFADLWVRPDFQNWLKSYVKSGETREKQGKGKRLKGKG